MGYTTLLNGSKILQRVKGAVASYSLHKLHPSALNCLRVRRDDDNAEMDVGFVGNKLDIGAVQSWVNRNMVANPLLTVDSDVNGIADNWLSINNNQTSSYSISDNAQKIQLTAINGAGYTAVYQTVLNVTAGETIDCSVDVKFELTNGSGVYCESVLFFQDNASATISTVTFGNVSTTSDWVNKTALSKIAPPNCVKVKWELRLRGGGDTSARGIAWYKNAIITKPVAFALQDKLTTDSNADGVADGWTPISSTCSIANGQRLVATSSDSFLYREITGFAVNEVVNFLVDIKGTIGANALQIRIRFMDNANTNLLESTTTIATENVTSNYRTYSVTGTAPANTTKIRLYVNAKNTGDDITFTNVYVYRKNVSVYIKTWYDQLSTNHATQTTTANQPTLINNGIVQVDDKGNNTLWFDGINDGFNLSDMLGSGTSGVSAAYVFSKRAFSAQSSIFGKELAFKFSADSSSKQSFLVSINGTEWDINGSSTNNLESNKTYLNSIVCKVNDKVKNYRNGIKNFDSAQNYTMIGTNANTYGLGKVNNYLDGTISEFILFTRDLSDSERQLLEKDQSKRFNIPLTG